jgi:thiol-disulfide isomerase/thioredoxin
MESRHADRDASLVARHLCQDLAEFTGDPRVFAQQPHNRRRFFGLAALSLAGAWIGTRDSVQLIMMKPFRPSGASDLASLGRATAWLNSSAMTVADLQGKVVLIDFWTYTCINWLRTVPYVRTWAARYREQGLVVIGVHTPEFTFEEHVDNVRRSATERGITYPIAIDNDRAIWSGFGNHYWPALYFIDRSGQVRDHHFGEGNYEESELRIRELLATRSSRSGLEGQSVSFEAHGPEVGLEQLEVA